MSLKNRAGGAVSPAMDVNGSPTSAEIPLLPRTGRPSRGRTEKTEKSQPRWLTLEFLLYYVVIAVGLPALFICAWGFSSANHINYYQYSRKLGKGWLLGRRVDNSDAQYASFRNNIPLLSYVLVGHILLSNVVQRQIPSLRPLFSLIFSLIFLSVIHGSSVIKILVLAAVNYAVAKYVGGRLGVALSWIWSLGVLFANNAYDGYKFASLSQDLAWLDKYKGINMRWWITFNFTTLRMISFAMDYYWQTNGGRDKSKYETHRQTCSECSSATHPGEQCSKSRIETPLSASSYNLLNYYTYLLYVPLYLAGPIITFNDFTAQLRHPPKSITMKSTLLYAVRWILVVLCMEWILHTIYVVAIKDTKAWGGFTPFQMSMVGYFNLKLIWLKLLIIWRYFRLWAMADRIETTENMTRCMSDNYSAIEFWRSWHRSFNRWLVRYVYIPLGGQRYYALNIFPTFTFVAVWHDISLKLLTWGWLVAIFILPELALRKSFATPQFRAKLGGWYRMLKGIAAVLNIWLMMIANLVGFAVGVDGVREMMRQIIFGEGGTVFLVCSFVAVFAAVQLMFELREEEKRRGWKK
ncbi:hypothetical protein, variant [Spizellomyces punctatus DAOM BR117]|uniref:MBOAT family protein n=1 Tax=Spizellomyces punctatus (strain DAOM BR117) TaxID=645134 RepID=A0A0L0H868_SPIPD|nr:hypothetical protein, variant [Spizellomyces punctatus DAOM BR117]KNC97131.1 hypothetical protein, variant [Spizellomyces punctatus DAOM BR117]|eukprot:XP_016605171.1 hypothetical protein, variant [Spizellomyces punctatus DAOM BR117]